MSNIFGYVFILCTIVFILSAVVLIGITPLRQVSQRISLEKSTSLIIKNIESEVLTTTQTVIGALSQSEDLENMLISGSTKSKTQVALNLSKDILDAAIVYLMDTTGIVVASTSFKNDRQEITSLTGNNYAFRPYFTKAIKGNLTIYPAVGVTTNKRGIYYSSPVKHNNKVIGVIVVKLGLSKLDSLIKNDPRKIIITSPQKVTFSTNEKTWLYGVEEIYYDSIINIINSTKQFNNNTLRPLPFAFNNSNVIINDTNYIVERSKLSIPGWNISVFEKENTNQKLNKSFIKVIYLTLLSIMVLGGIILVLLIVISRKRKVERALRHNKENLKITMNSIGDGVIAMDNDGIITQINTVGSKLTGWTREEAIGADIKQVFRVVLPGTYKPVKNIFRNDIVDDLILISKYNNEIEVSKLTSQIKNDKNEIVGLVLVFRDITDQKETKLKLTKQYEQTKEALKKAKESDLLKTAFLQNISHEIRTPLNGIIGFSELLSTSESTPAEKMNYRNHIVSNGKYLLSIIQDVIEVSKLESGQVSVNTELFDLNKVLTQLYEKFKGIKHSDTELNLSLPNSNKFFEINTDKYKLNKILTNLLDNAFKFTKSGNVEYGYIILNNEVKFYVKDSGIGISKEQHKKIFKQFSQVETKRYQTTKGVGIGLSIVKKYVTLLKGKIWLESELDVGTTFYFTIPLS